MAPMSDPVNHPSHYHSEYWHPACGKTIECIDIVRHMGFNLGNALKYIWRAGAKGDEVQDLEKAIWYLNDRISEVKRLREAEKQAAAVDEGRAELLERLQGKPLTEEGIHFFILTAETANQNWAAFNHQPFYLQLPDRGSVRDELIEAILKLPPTEFDRLAPWVREAVIDWQWATGARGDC
jgi:hypothetical protein